jgi:hypothetical protein
MGAYDPSLAVSFGTGLRDPSRHRLIDMIPLSHHDIPIARLQTCLLDRVSPVRAPHGDLSSSVVVHASTHLPTCRDGTHAT